MNTLKKGSKGDEVTVLQHLLNTEGIKVTVDGDFGSNTEAAVKKYQKAHGLVADGIVGAKTWAALGVNDSKSVAPSVIYAPLKSCITKKSGRSIKYLIIHYTAGYTSKAGTARAIKAYWERANTASADFAVDDAEMVQFNPDIKNYYTWAVSGGNGIYNSNSVSIEICSSLKSGTNVKVPNHEGWYFTDAALENAVKLAKILMQKYNIPIERVVRHFDVTGKNCPGVVGWNDGALYNTDGTKTGKRNNSVKWNAFKQRLVK